MDVEESLGDGDSAQTDPKLSIREGIELAGSTLVLLRGTVYSVGRRELPAQLVAGLWMEEFARCRRIELRSMVSVSCGADVDVEGHSSDLVSNLHNSLGYAKVGSGWRLLDPIA
jgi:hypothetical protein